MSIAATVQELADSPKRSKNRATRRFLIVGPETLADAKYVTINPTGEASYCPTMYDGLVISDYSVEEIVGKPGYYIAEITYEPLDLQEPQHEPGDAYEFAKITVNFTTKGQTTTRFYGFSDNNSCTPYVEGDESKTQLWQTTQHGAFVGVTDDEIQGVEVIIPTLEFTVTKEFPSPAITMAQVRLLYSLTGTVNADFFLGFSPVNSYIRVWMRVTTMANGACLTNSRLSQTSQISSSRHRCSTNNSKSSLGYLKWVIKRAGSTCGWSSSTATDQSKKC